jgi:hypothetical protein
MTTQSLCRAGTPSLHVIMKTQLQYEEIQLVVRALEWWGSWSTDTIKP